MLKLISLKLTVGATVVALKTANIILPGLMIKQVRLQAKWYSNSLNCIMLVES